MRKTNRKVTVAGLLLSLFMAALEMTVVSTAMPTVVAELGGALHYAWVFSAYMLSSTVMVPIFGKLADLYGRKPVLYAALSLFLVGSMASGQAQSMTALIVFRMIQGIGAGGLQPIALTVVGDIFGVEERARMQGMFGAVWAIAGLSGPLLGGLIVSALSWRWVFYINVVPGILSGILIQLGLVETIEKKAHKLDIAGALLLSVGIVALLLGLEEVLPWVLFPASAVAIVLFLVVEHRVPEPMLPPRLFRTPVIAVSSILQTAAGAVFIGLATFLPLHAQGVLGATPTQAGTAIATMSVSWPIASATSGRLIKHLGFRNLVRLGMGLIGATGIGLVLVITRGASLFAIQAVSACFGIGMGLANTALVIAVQSSVTFAERGVATSSTMFFRNIGGTVGVGIMGAVLGHELLKNAVATSELVARILGPERRTVPASILSAISGDLLHGLVHVMWICGGIAVFAALVAWTFPDVKPPDSWHHPQR